LAYFFLKSIVKIDYSTVKKVGTTKMQKKVLKLKKTVTLSPVEVPVELPVELPVAVLVQEKPKKVLKLKKSVLQEPVAPLVPVQEKPKKILVLQKGNPVPPVPTGSLTKAMEAFESIREYYESRDEPIPQADIKWFYNELEQEKKETQEFWANCSVTKAYLDATYQGCTDDQINMTVAKAQIEEKKKPIKETDIGPMPSYGTQEFWAWCMKRKKLRLQKEAEIIAAGGTVPPEKSKKPRAPKV
jgi:hypothetical protein